MSHSSNDDFSQLIGHVTPIKKPLVSPAFGVKPTQMKRKKQRIRETRHYRALESACHNFDHIDPELFQRMQNNRVHCEQHIDLHGFFVDSACNHLRNRLWQRQNRHLSCWRIIHGKGRRSSPYDRAPIKHTVLALLYNHPDVAAIAAIQDADNNSGAVIIAVHPIK